MNKLAGWKLLAKEAHGDQRNRHRVEGVDALEGGRRSMGGSTRKDDLEAGGCDEHRGFGLERTRVQHEGRMLPIEGALLEEEDLPRTVNHLFCRGADHGKSDAGLCQYWTQRPSKCH